MSAEQPVEDWLCAALGDAARAMAARYRDLLAPWALTYPQYVAMSWLWQEGDLAVSELAQRMGLDPSTMSPLVKRLEVAGLVDRDRDGADERRVLVSTTARGQELRDDVAHVPGAVSTATGMSEAEQRELVATLRRLTVAVTGG